MDSFIAFYYYEYGKRYGLKAEDTEIKFLSNETSKTDFYMFCESNPTFRTAASSKKTKGEAKYRSPVKCSVIVALATWRT
jgi:hypothetical protein